MKRLFWGGIMLLVTATSLSATVYQCMSVSKKIGDDDVVVWKNKDKLLAEEDKYKVVVTLSNKESSAKSELYNTGETFDTGENGTFKIYKNGKVTMYIAEKPLKDDVYMITIQVPDAMEAFYCIKK